MIEQIRAVLLEVVQKYQDTRIYHCQLEATQLEGTCCTLAGTVLDAETLAAVTSALVDRLPAITFDTPAVRVLRTSQPRHLAVGTHVAGLYAGPSFGEEMVSQLLNGWVVEVLSEQDRWVYVRQMDGYLGWTYRPHLVTVPAWDLTHIVRAPISLLREAPAQEAPLVSRLAGGTEVYVTAMEGPWARLTLAGGRKGWVPETDLRALSDLPREEAARRRQMVQDAARFIGVPYLWGGCTAFGIDCSGFTQLLHRLVGLNIPRDADMQHHAGQPVEPPFEPGDLLFFGGDSKHRAITHVAMSLGGWRIVHSSRTRNGIYEDDLQAVQWLKDMYVGARTFVTLDFSTPWSRLATLQQDDEKQEGASNETCTPQVGS